MLRTAPPAVGTALHPRAPRPPGQPLLSLPFALTPAHPHTPGGLSCPFSNTASANEACPQLPFTLCLKPQAPPETGALLQHAVMVLMLVCSLVVPASAVFPPGSRGGGPPVAAVAVSMAWAALWLPSVLGPLWSCWTSGGVCHRNTEWHVPPLLTFGWEEQVYGQARHRDGKYSTPGEGGPRLCRAHRPSDVSVTWRKSFHHSLAPVLHPLSFVARP